VSGGTNGSGGIQTPENEILVQHFSSLPVPVLLHGVFCCDDLFRRPDTAQIFGNGAPVLGSREKRIDHGGVYERSASPATQRVSFGRRERALLARGSLTRTLPPRLLCSPRENE
jgi:hypothetical protein